jgi:ATP-binding cassette subfamily G (WHITE) protein 2 (PDR)
METISVGKADSNDVSSDDAASYRGFTETTDQQIRALAREFTRQSVINEHQQQNNNKDEIDNLDITDNENIDAFHPDAPQERFQLLRTMTSMSQVPGISPIDEENNGIDPRLDPSNDNFNSKFWVKNMRKLLDTDPDYYKPTSLGFAAKNLIARGISSDADYQSNFLNFPFKVARDLYLEYFRKHDKSRYFEILKSMDVLIKPGTLTVVLGRPGAGCSTFLKTVASQTYGFQVDKDSIISYDGLTPQEIDKNYRGEVIFSAEMDNHFPHLSVGQTLEFAALLRTPQNRFPGVDRKAYAQHMAQVSIN